MGTRLFSSQWFFKTYGRLLEMKCDTCGFNMPHGIIFGYATAGGLWKSFICERDLMNPNLFNPCKRLYLWFPAKHGQLELTGF